MEEKHIMFQKYKNNEFKYRIYNIDSRIYIINDFNNPISSI